MPRFGFLLALALLATPFAVAQDGVGRSAPLPGGDARPDAEVLRKLAAQLGGGNGQLPFDPALIALAQKMFANGPPPLELLKDPEILKMAQEQKAKMTPEQLEQLKQQFLNPENPPQVGPQPPPQVGPQPFPQPLPQPQPPFPNVPQPNFPQPNDPRFPDFRPPPFQPGLPNGLPNTQSAKEAIEFWEKNIGSLNEMPAVRDALIALANSGLDGGPGGKTFWDDISKDLNGDFGGGGSSGGGFFKWLKDNTSNWSLGSNSGGSGWSPPGSSWGGGSGSGSGFGTPSAGSLGTVGIVILSLIAAVVIGLFIWKVLPVLREGYAPRPLPGHGPWPVDPRSIRTREQLVKAFEYLSILECGDQARSWNHVTIADALRQLVPDSAAYADALGRLYSVARYTPEAEPIDAVTIAEARGYLCQLARVSPA